MKKIFIAFFLFISKFACKQEKKLQFVKFNGEAQGTY